VRHSAVRVHVRIGLLVGLVLLAVPVRLALGGAEAIQVAAAAGGAAAAAVGVGLARAAWPRRKASEVPRLLFALGFFSVCAGIVTMLAGIGLYH
jgi:hypothetical protein